MVYKLFYEKSNCIYKFLAKKSFVLKQGCQLLRPLRPTQAQASLKMFEIFRKTQADSAINQLLEFERCLSYQVLQIVL